MRGFLLTGMNRADIFALKNRIFVCRTRHPFIVQYMREYASLPDSGWKEHSFANTRPTSLHIQQPILGLRGLAYAGAVIARF
jgi:hypothetical protein